MARPIEEIEAENMHLSGQLAQVREQRRGARRSVKHKALAHVLREQDLVRQRRAETGEAHADGAMAALARMQAMLEGLDERSEED